MATTMGSLTSILSGVSRVVWSMDVRMVPLAAGMRS